MDVGRLLTITRSERDPYAAEIKDRWHETDDSEQPCQRVGKCRKEPPNVALDGSSMVIQTDPTPTTVGDGRWGSAVRLGPVTRRAWSGPAKSSRVEPAPAGPTLRSELRSAVLVGRVAGVAEEWIEGLLRGALLLGCRGHRDGLLAIR